MTEPAIQEIFAKSDFFHRNIESIYIEQQQRIHSAVVTVIGCGGLGGYVAEQLARLGVGRLRICDPDCFSESNINRQLHARIATVGREKARVVAEQIRSLHGQTTVLAVCREFQHAEVEMFSNTEVVVDCLDSLDSRCELSEFCQDYQLPLVHGAVHQLYGQVGVQLPDTDLYRSMIGCPSVDEYPPPSVPAFTVGLIASLQVAETCKLLLGMDSSLHNNWLSIDLRRMTFDFAY